MGHISTRNNRTGNIVEFDWNHQQPPTDDDIQEIENQQAEAKKKEASNPLAPLMDIGSSAASYLPDIVQGGAETLGLPTSLPNLSDTVGNAIHHPIKTALKLNPLTGPLYGAMSGGMDQLAQAWGNRDKPLSGLETAGRVGAAALGPLGTLAAGAGEDIGSGDPHRIVRGAVKGSGAVLGGRAIAKMPTSSPLEPITYDEPLNPHASVDAATNQYFQPPKTQTPEQAQFDADVRSGKYGSLKKLSDLQEPLDPAANKLAQELHEILNFMYNDKNAVPGGQ